MTDLELLSMIIVFAVGFFAGKWYANFVIAKEILDSLTDSERQQLEHLKENLLKVDMEDTEAVNRVISQAEARLNLQFITHEIVNEQHYFYGQVDLAFICQGSTVEEAAENFARVTANRVYGCVIEETGDKFYIVNGKIQQELSNV